MKKTIVAAAVAALVAAPAAFADVKISGNMIQEFINDGDDTGTSEDGLESQSAVDVVFSVSEDLGNGMSAFAKIHTMYDDGQGGQTTADQIVGLKGDFGTIVVGKMEDFSESKVSAMGATDSSDALSIETNRSFKTGRANGGIAYISPSFNGLTFGVAGYAMDNGGAAAVAATTTTVTSSTGSSGTFTTAGTDAVSKDADANIDATDIMVEYANGPLLVRAAYENVDKSAYDVNQTTGKDQKTTTIGASYKLDNITLQAVHFDVENGGGTDTNDADGWFVGAKVAMGANTFGIGYAEETDVDTNVETTGDDKNMLISVDHALSKRTSITAAYEENEDGTAGANNDRWAVGIKHVF
jgi:predicted porin